MDAVGLFRPYDQKTPTSEPTPAATPQPTVVAAPSGAAPKNRPTPTRQQAQAARMDAIHPKLTKRQASAQDRAAEEKKRLAQLQAADNQPERVLLRNHVDSRWSIAQFMLPLVLLGFAGSVASVNYPVISGAFIIVLYAFVVACIINCWWSWQSFKRELNQRLPHASTKGLVWMMITRMMSVPRMRQPKPVVKHGEAY